MEKQSNDAQFQAQVKNFEAGVRYFQKQNYEKAKEVFEKLLGGSYREVAHRAGVYLRLCEQKLNRSANAPKGAEDYYTLGVAELNARNLDSAIQHLNTADKMAPGRDYIHYALAAAHARQGNVEAALEHLKTAIALRPENRLLARRDED